MVIDTLDYGGIIKEMVMELLHLKRVINMSDSLRTVTSMVREPIFWLMAINISVNGKVGKQMVREPTS